MNESIVTAHPTEFELRRYLERTLDADALLRVDDHIAVCDICRDFTASVAGVERRVASLVVAEPSALIQAAAPVCDVRWGRTGWADLAAAAAVLAAVAGGWWIGLANYRQPAPAMAQA